MVRANEPASDSSQNAPAGVELETPIRILLVTPQKILETGLLALLGGVPEFKVVGTASSGRETLSLIAKVRPSVLIAEGHLPDLTPTELIRRVANDNAQPRVLCLYSNETWRTVIDVFRAGAWGYMSMHRPFECMKTALYSIARGRRFVDGETGGDLACAWCELRGTTTEVALASLSTREHEVFRLLVEGRNSQEISKSLYISRKTVETHRRAVHRKLKVRDLAELMKFAVRNQLVRP